MILTKERVDHATGFVENIPVQRGHLDPNVKKRILNSAVRLKGSNASNDVFNGSGVIVNAKSLGSSKYKVTILTAMHNVAVWGGKNAPDIPDTNAIKSFTERVKVWYGKGDLIFNTDPNGTAPVSPGSQIGNLCGTRPNCYYDLLVLESGEKALFDYAKAFVFGDQEDTIVQEAKDFPSNFESLLDRERYVYVQLGFGKTTSKRQKYKIGNDKKLIAETTTVKDRITRQDKTVPYEVAANCPNDVKMTDLQLHYRLTVPLSSKKSGSAYDLIPKVGQVPTYLEYVNPILIKGSPISTTAPGDSGGPLWAINRKLEKIGDRQYPKYTKAYLIGVTSGGDMQLAAKLSPLYDNCVSTSVAPYFASIKAS